MKLPKPVTLAAVALAGLCTLLDAPKLRHALRDDQTLFLLGAEVIRDGGVLYRDFWDIKPPGIFLLYLAGGRLFGFTDVGIRVMELVILAGFAVLAFLWLRSGIGARAAWLGALLLIPYYNSIGNESDLGTVEGLACLPLAIAAFGLLAPYSEWRLILAGASIGVMILLKPFYVLLGAAFWLVFLLTNRTAGRRVRTWAILLISATVPIAATVSWFALRGALPDLIDAVIRVPYEARYVVNPLDRLWILRSGFEHVWHGTLALRLLLIPAAWAAYAKRHDRGMAIALTFLVTWIAAGTIAILLQLQSWWIYHWLLILPPLAMLAGLGLDWAIDRIVRAAPLQRLIAALVVAIALWDAKGLARPFAADLLTPKGAATVNRYRDIRQYEARQVRCAPSDTAFVWMSPLISRFTNCRLASPIEGDNMVVLPPSIFKRARTDIERSRPLYMYLNRRDVLREAPLPNFETAMPGVLEQYEEVFRGDLGSWYRLKQ
jgi:hypothetical protein